jgi:hypothetical protein
VLVEIDRLLGDAADHDAIAEHVEHQDIELARVSQELFRNILILPSHSSQAQLRPYPAIA